MLFKCKMEVTNTAVLVLTQFVVPATRSRTYTSPLEDAGTPGARPLAVLEKATRRPSGVMTASAMIELGPNAPVLTKVVVWAIKSRTKTSRVALVSPATRFVAALMKATKRPSGS